MSGLFLRTAKPLLCLHFCVLGVRQKGGVFESVRRTDPKKKRNFVNIWGQFLLSVCCEDICSGMSSKQIWFSLLWPLLSIIYTSTQNNFLNKSNSKQKKVCFLILMSSRYNPFWTFWGFISVNQGQSDEKLEHFLWPLQLFLTVQKHASKDK